MSETTYYKYISNGAHYTDVIAKIANVKHHLWIGTADIKDLYVKSSSMTVPFLKVISRLIERGVEVRLIHAKEPGPNFRKDFDDYSILAKRLERVLCPRVHFKMVIFDLETAYVGSANLTGAGLGMKEGTEKVPFFYDQNGKCLRFVTSLSANHLNKAKIDRK